MIQSVQNNLVITMATKYIRNISDIMKRANIQNISSVSPTDMVQIIGKVESIPKRVTTCKRDYKGFSTKDLQVGDTLLFRYDVVYDFK